LFRFFCFFLLFRPWILGIAGNCTIVRMNSNSMNSIQNSSGDGYRTYKTCRQK
jgi:hypothetical protein